MFLRKNKYDYLNLKKCNLLCSWPLLLIVIVFISSIGNYLYHEFKVNADNSDNDKLLLSMITRDVEMGFEQIEQTPAWFRYQIIYLYTDRIHDTLPRRIKPSFEIKVKEFLVIKFIDLNKDSMPEVMINYSGVAYCGNKDCPTEIYEVLPEEKSLRQIGSVTPWAYNIFNINSRYKPISNCIYSDGRVELLVYSARTKKYESKDIPGSYHYDMGRGHGCKIFDNKRLQIPVTTVKEIVNASDK